MRIAMVDNYDSFTYNLVQVLRSSSAKVDVVRNDKTTPAQLLDGRYDGIVLSPGPGRPEDAGLCLELLEHRPDLPLFGVCLGHQVLGQAFGGEVGRARELMHGKTSAVRHEGARIFEGLSNPFVATRYHSLEVRRSSIGPEIEETAWSEDGTLMGLRHRDLPYWGVQFHPESILTTEGPRMLENFLSICSSFVQREAVS